MPFTFVFMADTQLGCYATFAGASDDDHERFLSMGMKVPRIPPAEGFEWDARRFEEAIYLVNEIGPDFVVVGGDMINDISDPDQLAAVMEIAGRLEGSIPIYWVPGNHDACVDGVVPTDEGLDFYRRNFGDDRWAIERDGAGLIAINSSVLDHPEMVPIELDAHFEFLEAELKKSRERGDRHTIVFMHHPIFVEWRDEEDTYWNIPLERRERLLELLHEYGVRSTFHGHLHRNCIAHDGDLELVTTGPVGFPLGDDPSGLTLVKVGAEVTHEYIPLPIPVEAAAKLQLEQTDA